MKTEQELHQLKVACTRCKVSWITSAGVCDCFLCGERLLESGPFEKEQLVKKKSKPKLRRIK